MYKNSLIIPVFNNTPLLRLALLSLIHQSCLPDEVIISDDGSSENILSVIREYQSQYKFKVKYVRQANKGFRLASCRNNGVRFSQGDYLIFLDQDLIYTKHFVRTMLESRENNHFCVSYPIRLTQSQTQVIEEAIVRAFDFDLLLSKKQLKKIKKQYRKDKLYYYLKRLKLRKTGPKLRGGVVGINREEFFKINGYDENYQRWGNEDDDLGRRFYQIGVIGKNISMDEFPMHLYHIPFHNNGKRINKPYHSKRMVEIKQGNYRAVNGLLNPLDHEEPEYLEIN